MSTVERVLGVSIETVQTHTIGGAMNYVKIKALVATTL